MPTSIKAAQHSKNVKILGRVSKVVGTTIGAVLQLITTALDILDCKDQMSEWISLLKKELAKYPCENDDNRWSSIWNRSVANTLGFAYLSIQTIQADIAGCKSNPFLSPTANIATGSTIEKGTAITLHCSTEGAQIYYTLDGSCPCDNTEARKLYDGTPIPINADTEIKAMACMDGEESEVVTFFYKVLIPDNVSNASAKGIKVYPTLVKDILNVDISEGTKGYLFITDTNGRQILSIDNAKPHNTINMTGLTSGMYVVVVRTEDGKCTTKIIKL